MTAPAHNIAIGVINLFTALEGRTILRDLSFTARYGEFIGLAGPNGAGKSTLLKALAGVIPHDGGAVHINGVAAPDLHLRERARLVSYLPQARPVYWAMPAREIVALGRFAYGAGKLDEPGAQAVERAMEQTGIRHLAARAVTELSGGELARVHMARALASEAQILLADEPTAALDPAHQLSLMTILKARAERGALVIAALHDLPLAARFCSRIIVLSDGHIAADDTPAKALTAALLRDVFHIDASINQTSEGIAFRFETL